MYHTDAIILKKEGWNEADLMITALTERFGKIRMLAQGARKHGAKLQGHLESCSLAELSFVAGRNGYRLIGAQLQEFFPNLRRDAAALASAAIMAETLARNLFEERDGAGRYFELLAESLAALEAASGAMVGEVLLKFHTRFLHSAGVLAESEGQTNLTVLYERAGHTITPPRAVFVPDLWLY